MSNTQPTKADDALDLAMIDLAHAGEATPDWIIALALLMTILEIEG